MKTLQEQFKEGTLVFPEGVYSGSPHVLFGFDAIVRAMWVGKMFNSDQRNGFNILTKIGASSLRLSSDTRAYQFTVSVGPSIKNPSQQVLILDYSSQNSWPVNHIRDEVVATDPNKFLGRVLVKVFDHFITIGYWSMVKNNPSAET